jgi:hypothetical protein
LHTPRPIPGRINMASNGIGLGTHVVGELFKSVQVQFVLIRTRRNYVKGAKVGLKQLSLIIN